MTFASMADRDGIQAEMACEARDLPVTIFGALTAIAAAHPKRPAVSFQLFSGPKDPAETRD